MEVIALPWKDPSSNAFFSISGDKTSSENSSAGC